MPGREVLPSTVRRSPDKAQRTWAKTHDSAVETYGEGERAHRTAFAALKHEFEKVGDHWEPKGRKGPKQTSFFLNVGAIGAQFEAVAAYVYERARDKGLGHEIPTEWFLQDERD